MADVKAVIKVLALLITLSGCGTFSTNNEKAHIPCPATKIQHIEAAITSSDGDGHGPDIGSSEWFSVIERRLSLENHPALPPQGSLAWCDFIQSAL